MFGVIIGASLVVVLTPIVRLTGVGPYGANIFNPRDWGGGSIETSNTITLEFTRVVLAIGVFAIGVELPKAYMARHWRSLFFLLVPVMTWVRLHLLKTVQATNLFTLHRRAGSYQPASSMRSSPDSISSRPWQLQPVSPRRIPSWPQQLSVVSTQTSTYPRTCATSSRPSLAATTARHSHSFSSRSISSMMAKWGRPSGTGSCTCGSVSGFSAPPRRR